MNTTQNSLIITITNAILTRDIITTGAMDPYFVAKINGSAIYQSSVQTGAGKSPNWNEKFVFNYENQQYLTLEIYHGKKIVKI
jgi:hypothetical protein